MVLCLGVQQTRFFHNQALYLYRNGPRPEKSRNIFKQVALNRGAQTMAWRVSSAEMTQSQRAKARAESVAPNLGSRPHVHRNRTAGPNGSQQQFGVEQRSVALKDCTDEH